MPDQDPKPDPPTLALSSLTLTQSPPSIWSQPTSLLFTLPAELRLQIYDLILPQTPLPKIPIDLTSPPTQMHPPPVLLALNLLLTCKRLHHETAKRIYTLNSLSIECSAFASRTSAARFHRFATLHPGLQNGNVRTLTVFVGRADSLSKISWMGWMGGWMGVREGLRGLRDGSAADVDEDGAGEREVRVILEFGERERRRVEFGVGRESEVAEGFAKAREVGEWREAEKEKLGRIERTVGRTLFG